MKVHKMRKEYPRCKFCGEPVVAPFHMEAHFHCSAIDFYTNKLEIDIKDVKFKKK